MDHDPRWLGREAELVGRREQPPEGLPKSVEALAGDGGKRESRYLVTGTCLAEDGPPLGRRWQVDLVEHDQDRLLEQRRIVGAELLADHVVVPFRIPVRTIHDLHQHPRSLDMAE